MEVVGRRVFREESENGTISLTTPRVNLVIVYQITDRNRPSRTPFSTYFYPRDLSPLISPRGSCHGISYTKTIKVSVVSPKQLIWISFPIIRL